MSMFGETTITPPEIFEVTNSSITLFKRCRYSWLLSYVFNMAPLITPHYFDDGDIFHSTLDRYYQNHSKTKVLAYIDRRYKELAKDLVMKAPHIVEKLEERNTILQGMMSGYYELRAPDKKKWRVLWAEKKFSIDCEDADGEQFLYRGKRDMKIQDENGDFWVVEHKTASSIGSQYVQKLGMDTQILTYIWADRQAEPDRVKGCFYNVIKKPGIRQKQNETRDEYLQRLKDEYQNEEKYYYREKIKPKKRMLTKFFREVQEIVPEMRRVAEDAKKAHRSEGACDDYGGCIFRPICLTKKMKGAHMEYYKIKETNHPELDRR